MEGEAFVCPGKIEGREWSLRMERGRPGVERSRGVDGEMSTDMVALQVDLSFLRSSDLTQ